MALEADPRIPPKQKKMARHILLIGSFGRKIGTFLHRWYKSLLQKKCQFRAFIHHLKIGVKKYGLYFGQEIVFETKNASALLVQSVIKRKIEKISNFKLLSCARVRVRNLRSTNLSKNWGLKICRQNGPDLISRRHE